MNEKQFCQKREGRRQKGKFRKTTRDQKPEMKIDELAKRQGNKHTKYTRGKDEQGQIKLIRAGKITKTGIT